jgi:hypothetical protein
MRVLSLGAGVQSSALALMASTTMHPDQRPDVAIFADTGWEPKAVYQWLDWLETKLAFPLVRVSRGNLREEVLKKHFLPSHFSPVPFYFRHEDSPGIAMGRRQCTYQYKIRPIYAEIKKRLGGTPKGGCELWVGISTDEAARMRPARVQYIVNRWPLIELRMSRGDCLEWMKRHDYPQPPRSACLGCPFKSDAEWRATKDGDPAEWADTLMVDDRLRSLGEFMHRTAKPLGLVDLSTAEDRGQINMFNNECEGMCGV